MELEGERQQRVAAQSGDPGEPLLFVLVCASVSLGDCGHGYCGLCDIGS